MSSFRKVTEFKSVSEFREFLHQENIDIPLADSVPVGGSAKLAEKVPHRDRVIGNRWAILPMEGWDCLPDGNPSDYTKRRWLRFASSGAKLIYGTEAAAVCTDGRSNTRQLMITDRTVSELARLSDQMRQTHAEKFGTADDLLIGLQLTHSGRFSHPYDDLKLASRTAYAHPFLDRKFHNDASNVVSDDDLKRLIDVFAHAAKLAHRAGFDFIDFKHAHGYLAHELLSARTRPGMFGGSFENRTRFFRLTAEAIRSEAPEIELSMRVSFCDFIPFEKGPDGVGRPMASDGGYPCAFGGDGTGFGWNLDEPVEFLKMAQQYGVSMICGTIGSPYYVPHIQRPAYYPVSDGYLMPEHPLKQVARHLAVTREIKRRVPDMLIIGSGYTCLQEFLPNAAEAALQAGDADFAGIGRMVLSYPEMPADVLAGRPLAKRCICRTFGDCTSAPRNGLVSGCYPLDHFYKVLPQAQTLKACKLAAKK